MLSIARKLENLATLGARELRGAYYYLTSSLTSLEDWWLSGNGVQVCPELVRCPSTGNNFEVESSDDLLSWNGILWGVPKKRTSYSKKRRRNSHKQLTPKKNITVCKKCQGLKLLHTLCPYCLKKTLEETAKVRKEIAARASKLKELVQVNGDVQS